MKGALRIRFVVAMAVVTGVAIPLLTSRAAARQRAASALATAATEWLAALTPEQRQQATFPLEADERQRWNFIPTAQFPRNGLPLKSMTIPQRERAHGLLRAGLSQRGYLTATGIIDLENILREIEGADTAQGRTRDPELYFFTVFGAPAARGAWAWRVEGHHVSLHFAVDNGKASVSTAPAFFGSNPAEVPDGPKKGQRVLGGQEDAARALLESLEGAVRSAAIISTTAPNDIVTRTQLKVDLLEPAGLPAARMTGPQRALLMQLVEVYTSLMTPDTAADRMAKIRAGGTDKIAFAWAGETERKKPHYYRVQGPTFLVEYDNTQTNANHIHSVWRDFNGDFGRDLLGQHLATVSHDESRARR
jgi:hypothetical protein